MITPCELALITAVAAFAAAVFFWYDARKINNDTRALMVDLGYIKEQ